MTQRFIYIFLLLPFFLVAQNVVQGKLNPKEKSHNSLVIYQMKGSQFKFINYGKIAEDGNFKVDIPQDCNAGIYRLVYGYGRKGFVDFVFNHTNIELNFDSKDAFNSVSFENSEENKHYYEFVRKSKIFNKKIDSIELAYIDNHKKLEETLESQKKSRTNSKSDTKTIKQLKSDLQKNKLNYKEELKKYNNFQSEKINEAEGMLVVNYLKAKRHYHTPEPAKNIIELAGNLKKNHFKNVDFNNDYLINSPILFNKIMDYVFDIGKSIDSILGQEPYINSVDEVLYMITDEEVKKDVINQAMYVSAEIENRKLFDYLLRNHYNKLKVSNQDQKFVKKLQSKLSVAVGEFAPNFSWTEKGVKKDLKRLNKADQYILVFWSTTCGHCKRQIPKLYEFTKDRADIHVVSYALEDEEKSFEEYKKQLTKWTNVLGLKKWDNPVAIEYQIDATPTYIILDKAKKIIKKPYGLKELKVFFEKRS